jgi:transcriptional regulator with XRE-family HTH domain
MNLNQIGERVRTLRKAKNYTAEDLADKLGISVSAYYRIERNEVTIDLPTLEKIVNVLGITFVDLFDEGSNPSNQQLADFMSHITNTLRKVDSNMEIMLKEILRLRRMAQQEDALRN